MSERTEQQFGGKQDGTEQDREAAAVRQLHHELASAPAAEVVAQAVAHLATFAYVRLGVPPQENQRYRDLGAARVLIDALGGLLGAVDGRLGQVEGELREALAGLRMTYASVAGQQGAAAAPGGPAPPGPPEPPEPPGPPPPEEPRLQRPSGLWVPGQD